MGSISAQKYFTRSAKITFFSDARVEKIEAVNNSAISVLDASTGNMEFAVLIKGFQFQKSLMQEHFNENYMESSKYPKAIFKGRVNNWSEINLQKDGEYTANIDGEITVHGVTKKIETTATFIIKEGLISATSVFELTVADFKIKIPRVVRDNIAKKVAVTVSVNNYQLFNN